MIYVTGDTHNDFSRFGGKRLRRRGLELTEQDYVIVCGDFGLCWKKDKTFEYNCKNFSLKQYTILWVQGNHENYDMIAEFPIEEWHGGKVRHIIRDKVILLERGQVFHIDGKVFFTFGGAASHDIQGGVLNREDKDFIEQRKKVTRSGLPFRILHETWWPEELPDKKEIEEARKNLARIGNKVDYIITHCCSTSIQNELDKGVIHFYEPDYLTDFFQEIEETVEYKHWYFGHYHDNIDIDDKHTLLYHAILILGEDEKVEDIPVIGRPRYKYYDMVKFTISSTEVKTGEIHVVDADGSLGQNLEPSYDIFVQDENCLYKHIEESRIIEKIKIC